MTGRCDALHGRRRKGGSTGTLRDHAYAVDGTRAGAATNTRFVRAFVRALELDRLVLHGWSTCGLVTVLAADLAPERVVGLVLATPTVP